MRGTTTLALLLAGGLLLGGCGLLGSDGADRLVEPTWQLTTLRSPDGTTTPVDSLVGRPDSGAVYTLTFRDDGQLGGVADCNSYGADYVDRDDSTLSVETLVSTQKYCGEGSREALYLEALSAADAYEFDEEGLRIRFEGEGALRFERQGDS